MFTLRQFLGLYNVFQTRAVIVSLDICVAFDFIDKTVPRIYLFGNGVPAKYVPALEQIFRILCSHLPPVAISYVQLVVFYTSGDWSRF